MSANPELFTAIKANNLPLVKALLRVHPQEPYKDSYGNTALHRAAFYGHKEIVDFLISEFRFYINIQNEIGETPLMIACYCKHKEIYEAFLKNPKVIINPRLKDKQNGYSVLHYASITNNLDLAKLLLETPNLGMDINQRDDSDFSVLMTASIRGQAEMVRYLLTVPNVDIHYINRFGDSALKLAQKVKNSNVLKVFEEKMSQDKVSASVKTTPVKPTADLNLEPKAFDLKTISEDAIRMMEIAMSGEVHDTDVGKLLEKIGNEINTPFFLLKNTALHCAIQRKDMHLAFRLIISGASLTLKNSIGSTPLDLAEKNKEAYLFMRHLYQVKLAANRAIKEITQNHRPIETKRLSEKKEMADIADHNHLKIEMDKQLNLLFQDFNTLSDFNQQRTAFFLGRFLAYPHDLVYHPQKAYEVLTLVSPSDVDYAQAQDLKKDLVVALNKDLGSETRSKVTLQHEVEALKKEAEAQKLENELLKQRLATATKALEVATETQKLSNELLTQRLNSATQALEVANEAQKYLLRELETSHHAGLLLQAKASQSRTQPQNDVIDIKLKLDVV